MIHNAALDLESQAFNERDSMVFFHPQWEKGNVSLKDGTVINNIPLLYDLERDQLEILLVEEIELYGGEGMMDTTIKIYEQHELSAFDFIAHVKNEKEGKEEAFPHHFVNAERFSRDDSPATGIYEIIEEGTVGVISYPYLIKYAHRSNTFFDQDNMQREYNRRQTDNRYNHPDDVYYSYKLKGTIYLLINNRLIIDIPTRKKEFIGLFEGKESEVSGFIKNNGLQYKNKEDLIQIVQYFNSIQIN